MIILNLIQCTIVLSATMEMYTQLHQKYIRDKDSKERVENIIESVAQRVWKKGHTIGIEEGKEKGITEAVKTIALNLMRIGTDDAVILQVTGLTPEELERIKSEL